MKHLKKTIEFRRGNITWTSSIVVDLPLWKVVIIKIIEFLSRMVDYQTEQERYYKKVNDGLGIENLKYRDLYRKTKNKLEAKTRKHKSYRRGL